MAGEPLLLAIDQGTTNTKGLLVSRSGTPVFVTSAELQVSHPSADWVEQDALALWHSVEQVVAECLAFAGLSSIAAVGIANQRETVVAWDRSTGEPIAPAIVWQCRRSSEICQDLRRRGMEERLQRFSGLGIDPLFSASKLTWLLDFTPGLRDRVSAGEVCFGTVDSWLIFNLTGGKVHACDSSNASRTQIFDIERNNWSEELLSIFRIPRSTLPQVGDSSGLFGYCASIPGLDGIPILSAIGDSHAALAAHGRYTPGTVKATFGTGSSVMTLLPHGSVRQPAVATTVAWRVGGQTQFALEGNITMTGSALKWVGEFLGLPQPAADAAALASTVSDAAGLTFVPAMVGLGSPHWSTGARGLVAGIGLTSRASHLARAALEAIAFQVRDVFDVMQQEAGCDLPALYADGGATRNATLMQFQADILGRPVQRSTVEELSALGAAWFAGLALGWWGSFDELGGLRSQTVDFAPRMSSAERDDRYGRWRDAVSHAIPSETSQVRRS